MANINSLTLGNTTLPVANSLASLSDTSTSNAAAGNILTFDGANWTTGTLTGNNGVSVSRNGANYTLSGDASWAKTQAIAAPLTGLDTSQGGAVTASDTVLSAIGKLQANSGGGSGVIEGEYTIPEVYWCDGSGEKPPSGNTIAGQNANVWYQKTGKYVRAAICFFVYATAGSSTYSASIGFNSADLFGDGKLFPAGSDPAFFKFSGVCSSGPARLNSNAGIYLEPYFLLGVPRKPVGHVDVFLSGTNNIANFPSYAVGQKNTLLIEAVCL